MPDSLSLLLSGSWGWEWSSVPKAKILPEIVTCRACTARSTSISQHGYPSQYGYASQYGYLFVVCLTEKWKSLSNGQSCHWMRCVRLPVTHCHPYQWSSQHLSWVAQMLRGRDEVPNAMWWGWGEWGLQHDKWQPSFLPRVWRQN